MGYKLIVNEDYLNENRHGINSKDKNKVTELIIENSCNRKLTNHYFSNCESLKSVFMEDDINFGINPNIDFPDIKNSDYNGDSLFEKCEHLEYVHLPKNLKYITGNMFYNCVRLKEINIPENVTTLYHDSFNNCISLESITLPKKVQLISSQTFGNCTKLKKVIIENKDIAIFNGAFINTPYTNVINKLGYWYNLTMSDFVIFLNEINKDKNNIFKWVDNGRLNLKDIAFLLEEDYKGLREGIEYGI